MGNPPTLTPVARRRTVRCLMLKLTPKEVAWWEQRLEELQESEDLLFLEGWFIWRSWFINLFGLRFPEVVTPDDQ